VGATKTTDASTATETADVAAPASETADVAASETSAVTAAAKPAAGVGRDCNERNRQQQDGRGADAGAQHAFSTTGLCQFGMESF
jgi:hypothetical protein